MGVRWSSGNGPLSVALTFELWTQVSCVTHHSIMVNISNNFVILQRMSKIWPGQIQTYAQLNGIQPLSVTFTFETQELCVTHRLTLG